MGLGEISCEDGKRMEVAQNRIQMWILALAVLNPVLLPENYVLHSNIKPQLTSWLRCAKCSCNTNKNVNINKPLQFAGHKNSDQKNKYYLYLSLNITKLFSTLNTRKRNVFIVAKWVCRQLQVTNSKKQRQK